MSDEVPRLLPPDALKFMLGRELERALRMRTMLSLVTVRVERTSNGAPADEQTVVRVAEQVELVMREGDLLGHLEAGTLALVLTRSDHDQATRVAGRLMADFASQPFPSSLRLAIGVACYPTNATTATSLARWALTHPMTARRASTRTSVQSE